MAKIDNKWEFVDNNVEFIEYSSEIALSAQSGARRDSRLALFTQFPAPFSNCASGAACT